MSKSKKQKPSNQHKHELRVSANPKTLEIRNNADGSRSITGEAVVYNTLSEPLGGFRERIKPGAFTQSLKDNPDILIYYSHDASKILGRVSSGSLQINDTPTALRFTCKLPQTSWAADVIALASRGDLRSMSFGFTLVPGGDTWEEIDGEIIRTVNTANLFEISVVGDPAYKSSSFSLRSCPLSLRSKLKRDSDDDDEDYRPECDPDSDEFDEDADCEDDDEREICSQCGQLIPTEEDAAKRKAHLELLLRRLR